MTWNRSKHVVLYTKYNLIVLGQIFISFLYQNVVGFLLQNCQYGTVDWMNNAAGIITPFPPPQTVSISLITYNTRNAPLRLPCSLWRIPRAPIHCESTRRDMLWRPGTNPDTEVWKREVASQNASQSDGWAPRGGRIGGGGPNRCRSCYLTPLLCQHSENSLCTNRPSLLRILFWICRQSVNVAVRNSSLDTRYKTWKAFFRGKKKQQRLLPTYERKIRQRILKIFSRLKWLVEGR